jgi:hypothetical protein
MNELVGQDPGNPRPWQRAYVHGKFGDVRSAAFADIASCLRHVCAVRATSDSSPTADIGGASGSIFAARL